jgi:hypothetical protein
MPARLLGKPTPGAEPADQRARPRDHERRRLGSVNECGRLERPRGEVGRPGRRQLRYFRRSSSEITECQQTDHERTRKQRLFHDAPPRRQNGRGRLHRGDRPNHDGGSPPGRRVSSNVQIPSHLRGNQATVGDRSSYEFSTRTLQSGSQTPRRSSEPSKLIRVFMGRLWGHEATGTFASRYFWIAAVSRHGARNVGCAVVSGAGQRQVPPDRG